MYSGAGYTLLQLLIEEVSGTSFQDYMAESVLTPLGMEYSTFAWSDTLGWQRAQSFDVDGSTSHYSNFTALAAAGYLPRSSDLARFANANLGENGVLSTEMLAVMYTHQAFVNDVVFHQRTRAAG
ncbi:MAG: CubicO group peptidase (beta-lactamase class C family) [Rhodothermales bacterium]|jgi:CubicO group peptidase (beta-lactamase class C family)